MIKSYQVQTYNSASIILMGLAYYINSISKIALLVIPKIILRKDVYICL